MKSLRKLAIGPLSLLGWLAIVSFLSGSCQTATKQYAFSPLPDDGSRSSHYPDDAGDRFAVGDLVCLRFSGTVDKIPAYQERIKEDGTITLPLVGAVKAADKTLGELQNEVYHLYVPRFYKRLTITHLPYDRVYYVGGQVRSPGRQVYIGATTVTKAIESAGGFTESAARWAVKLVRPDGKTLKVNCRQALKDPSFDLSVYPGDKIDVPTTTPPEVRRRFEQ